MANQLYSADIHLSDTNNIYNLTEIHLSQANNDLFFSADIRIDHYELYYATATIWDTINQSYGADAYIRESRYSLADTLARKVLDLNSNNKVNIISFNTEYIEIILNTQVGSTTTIGENATSHTLQIEAIVNILDKTTVNDNNAERTAVPDDTEVKFEIDNVSTSSAMLNPIVAKTNGGKAETSLVVITPIGTDKIDVTVRAYLNQF